MIPSTEGLDRLTGNETTLRHGDRIAFFGDSITMQGGFVKQIAAALAERPATRRLDVKVFQHGLNGGCVPTVLTGESDWGDLGGSMEWWLRREKPTLVVIYVGVNDVWHGQRGTPPDAYEAGLRQMLALCRCASAAPILCTPTVIGEDVRPENRRNATLGQYAEIVRRIAREESAVLCDLHTIFTAYLMSANVAYQHAGLLTYDGVHMNETGNAVLADQIAASIFEAATACRQMCPSRSGGHVSH